MKLSITALALFFSVSSLFGQSTVPDGLNYQGFLTNAAGDPIGQGTAVTRTLAFRLYTGAEGGNPIWGEQQLVSVFNGNFSVILGNGVAINNEIPSGSPVLTEQLSDPPSASLFFGITEQGQIEFTPRQQILAGAFAHRAKVAEVAQSLSPELTTQLVADLIPAQTVNAATADFATTAGVANSINFTPVQAMNANFATTAGALQENAVITLRNGNVTNTQSSGSISIVQGGFGATNISLGEITLDRASRQTTYGGGGVGTVSDRRKKKDIKDLSVDLEKFLKLNTVHFRYKKMPASAPLISGFIAQEVQELYPEIVQEDEDGMLSILSMELLPVTIGAVQQQQEMINELETEIANFKKRELQMEKRLEALEQGLQRQQ